MKVEMISPIMLAKTMHPMQTIRSFIHVGLSCSISQFKRIHGFKK